MKLLWLLNAAVLLIILNFCCFVQTAKVKYTYVGCFRDVAKKRDLKVLHFAKGKASPAYCGAFCYKRKYAYFGLQHQSWCTCGNKFGKYGKVSRSRCNLPCDGDKRQFCGSALHNSIFKTGFTLFVKKSKKIRFSVPQKIKGKVIDKKAQNNLKKNTKAKQRKSKNTARRGSMTKIKYHYLGCFKDRTKRDLPVVYFAGKKASKRFCRHFCFSRKYLYFGLQAAYWCTCGQRYGKYGRLPHNKCRMRCAGNSRNRCGGSMANAIYKTGYIRKKSHKVAHTKAHVMSHKVKHPKVHVVSARSSKKRKSKSHGKYKIKVIKAHYLGCFHDQLKRDLKVIYKAGRRATKNFCHRYCYNRKFKFFGLQYKSWCTCGNSFGKYGKVSNKMCNMRCMGNSKQFCGSAWYNSIYATGYKKYRPSIRNRLRRWRRKLRKTRRLLKTKYKHHARRLQRTERHFARSLRKRLSRHRRKLRRIRRRHALKLKRRIRMYKKYVSKIWRSHHKKWVKSLSKRKSKRHSLIARYQRILRRHRFRVRRTRKRNAAHLRRSMRKHRLRLKRTKSRNVRQLRRRLRRHRRRVSRTRRRHSRRLRRRLRRHRLRLKQSIRKRNSSRKTKSRKRFNRRTHARLLRQTKRRQKLKLRRAKKRMSRRMKRRLRKHRRRLRRMKRRHDRRLKRKLRRHRLRLKKTKARHLRRLKQLKRRRQGLSRQHSRKTGRHHKRH